jgi:hypothetical protein
MYTDVEVFNGQGLQSPTSLHLWNLESPDALQHLKEEKVTHVVIFMDKLPGLQKSPLWGNLKEIYRNNDTKEILYRVVYPPD